MMDELKISLIDIMKKESLVDLIHEYSDYTIDLGGISIERFIDKEYLKHKRRNDIIIKSEIEGEKYIDEYDITKEVFEKYYTEQKNDISQSPYQEDNIYNDKFRNELLTELEKYKKENW